MRGIKKEFTRRVGALDGDFGFQGTNLVQAQRFHAIDLAGIQNNDELMFWVVPEDDAVPFLVEETLKGRADVGQVAHVALPNSGDAIGVELHIGTYQRDVFVTRLGHQHPVERVVVVEWHIYQ